MHYFNSVPFPECNTQSKTAKWQPSSKDCASHPSMPPLTPAYEEGSQLSESDNGLHVY